MNTSSPICGLCDLPSIYFNLSLSQNNQFICFMNIVSPYLSRGIFEDTESVPSGVPVLFDLEKIQIANINYKSDTNHLCYQHLIHNHKFEYHQYFLSKNKLYSYLFQLSTIQLTNRLTVVSHLDYYLYKF